MADEVERVLKLACLSRFVVLVLQVSFNHLVADYDSSSLVGVSRGKNSAEEIISFTFDGFSKWDSVYFIKVAHEGYKYEQYMAFFPLYPWLTRTISLIFQFLGPVVKFTNILLAVSCLVSCASFVGAAVFLYKLSLLVLKDKSMAYVAALLFCINPASVFMASSYTESVYSCYLFCGLYFLEYSNDLGNILLASVAFALGSATRSNGILSCGFITHSILENCISKLFSQVTPTVTLKCHSVIASVNILCSTFLKLLISNAIVLSPFVIFQWYGYILYCQSPTWSGTAIQAPPPQWCNWTIPMSYSYIQRHYWDVGFMRYFEVKQIPNFLLACPMVILCSYAIISYISNQNNTLTVKTLGLWHMESGVHPVKYQGNNKCTSHGHSTCSNGMFSPGVFVYVAHLIFLTGFGVTSMHVQVITRFIASSSPAFYWFTAHLMSRDISATKLSDTHYLKSVIITYFLVYSVIGIALHCNFYPWT